MVLMTYFYNLQDHLLKQGFKNDMDSPIISRFLLQGLKVDFMPTDPSVLGFSNRWYPSGVKTAIEFTMDNVDPIRIFTAPYFIASKLEAFKTRGKSDIYSSHDLEDIVFVLDHKDDIDAELINADDKVKGYLKEEFSLLLKNDSFEEALLGHVEQTNQMGRKERIMEVLVSFTNL